VREGKNLKGRAIALTFGIVGQRLFGKQLRGTIEAIEARNGGGDAAAAT